MENNAMGAINKNWKTYTCFWVVMACLSVTTSWGQDQGMKKSVFEMTLQELLEVKVVTATKHPEKIAEIPASVVIITRDEIEMYGYNTLEEILQCIPGFYMIDDYNWLSTINFGVRGFFSTGTFNDVIIMVNGVNQVGDSWSYYPDSKINVPVEAIDRIEVIRGPMSVIYGSGAFMGAINIITNQVPDTGPKNMVSASIGTAHSQKLFLRLAGKTLHSDYVFNGSIYDTHGLNVPFSEMISEVSYLESIGLPADARTGGLMEEKRKYLNFRGTFHHLTFDFGHVETAKEVFDGLPSVGVGTLISTDATNVTLSYSKDFSKTFSFKGQAGYYYHNYLLNYEILYEDAFAVNHVTTKAYEISLDAVIHPLPSLKLVTGLYHRAVTYYYKNYDYPIFANQYTNTEVYIPNGDNVITNAAYMQADFDLSSRLKVIGGLRLERLGSYDMHLSSANGTPVHTHLSGTYDNDDIKVIPRFAAIYSWKPGNSLKLLYGEAIKQPSIEQNTGMLQWPDLPSLKPARIKTIELNSLISPSDRLTLGISLFNNRLNHLISRKNEYDVEEGVWIIYSSNAGRMTTNGIEATMQWQPVTNIRLDLSGTYQDSKNKEDGFENIRPGYAPKFLAYARFSWQLPFNTKFAITGHYVGQMETQWNPEPMDPENNDWTPKGRIGDTIDGYCVFNINIRVENLFMQGLFAALRIANVLDQEVRYPTTRSNAWADKGTLGQGRYFLLSIGYKF